jgi:hypothetical protein
MNIKITQPDTPLTLTLTLSKREAMALRTIMRNIGGTTTGPRSVAYGIENAFRDQGIGYYYDNVEGNSYFPDKWDDLVANEDND